MDEAVELAARPHPVDATGGIVQAGLALIGEIDVPVSRDVEIVAALERL